MISCNNSDEKLEIVNKEKQKIKEIEILIGKMESIANSDDSLGMSELKISYIKKLEKVGNKVLPYLFKKLKSNDKLVVNLALHSIKIFMGLSKEQVNILMKIDNLKTYFAIAKNAPKDDDVIEFFMLKLKEKSHLARYINVFKYLDEEKVLKSIIGTYNCDSYFDLRECRAYLMKANRILKNIKERRAYIIKYFTSLLLNNKEDLIVRIASADILNLLNVSDDKLGNTLSLLFKEVEDPNLKREIKSLILSLGGKTSIKFFKEIFKSNLEYGKSRSRKNNLYLLGEIAKNGKENNILGETIINYINWNMEEERIRAIKTLATIKYKKAVPKFLEFIDLDDNIDLVYITIEALVDLKSKEALSKIKIVSEKYWYSPIRKFAKRAIKLINSDEGMNDNDRHSFWKYNIDKLEAKCKRKSIKKLENNYYPLSLKLKRGKLISYNNGFCGEGLDFKSIKLDYNLIEKNILGIYKLGTNIFVITVSIGLNSDNSIIYKIYEKNNKFYAKYWQHLPKESSSVALINDKMILIDNYITLDSFGKLKELECVK